MRFIIFMSIAVMALASGYALAADTPAAAPAATAPGDAGAPAPVAPDERQRLLDAGALMMQSKYDEAIEAAKGLLRGAKEDATRTGAARVIAESLRKKGEWKSAAAAYLKLRDHYEKASEHFVKNEAIAEILTASPAGLYPPLEAAAAKAAPAAPAAVPTSTSTSASETTPAKPAANLSDDDYLAKAIACLAAARIEKLKARIASIKKSRSPQEAEAAFAALAEDIRQAQFLAGSDSGASETAQAAAATTNTRLADLSKQVVATLTAKLADFQTAIKGRSLTLTQRKEMESLQTACTDLAKNESSFQETTSKLPGLTDASLLRNDSTQRASEYTRLAKSFEPPPVDNNRNNNLGGAGMGGGGGGGRGGGGRGGRGG
ncbi:MAG: hypothetical protein NT049_17385 [Planctomycetota bacterium]|nr:hypothetical protein [Planctomycetota bacterium]